MSYEKNDKNQESVYSKRLKAGKRRTYFFDVRETRGSDYYLIITESRKRYNEEGYDRHKIFLYKEDFNKFVKGLNEAVDYIKTELMPDYDFDAFNHDENSYNESSSSPSSDDSAEHVAPKTEETKPDTNAEKPATPDLTGSSDVSHASEEVDKW